MILSLHHHTPNLFPFLIFSSIKFLEHLSCVRNYGAVSGHRSELEVIASNRDRIAIEFLTGINLLELIAMLSCVRANANVLFDYILIGKSWVADSENHSYTTSPSINLNKFSQTKLVD